MIIEKLIESEEQNDEICIIKRLFKYNVYKKYEYLYENYNLAVYYSADLMKLILNKKISLNQLTDTQFKCLIEIVFDESKFVTITRSVSSDADTPTSIFRNISIFKKFSKYILSNDNELINTCDRYAKFRLKNNR